ncbi:MAG: MlaD family protein [Phycisphaeraceae bacterium]
MAQVTRHSFAAGLIILLSLAAIIIVTVLLGGISRWFEEQQSHTAIFPISEGVSGLSSGDDVRIGGLRVSTVDSIRLLTDDGDARLRVTFELPADVTLREGAVLTAESSFAGSAYLNISNLGSGSPLGPDQPITGRSRGIDDVIQTAAGIAEDVREMVRSAEQESLPQFNQTLAAAEAAARDIQTASTEAQTLVRDARPDVVQSLDTIRALVTQNEARINRILATGEQTATDLQQWVNRIRENPMLLFQGATRQDQQQQENGQPQEQDAGLPFGLDLLGGGNGDGQQPEDEQADDQQPRDRAEDDSDPPRTGE